MRRAIDRGALPPDTDIDLFRDAFVGTVFYRQLVSSQPISDDLPERMTALLGLPSRQ